MFRVSEDVAPATPLIEARGLPFPEQVSGDLWVELVVRVLQLLVEHVLKVVQTRGTSLTSGLEFAKILVRSMGSTSCET